MNVVDATASGAFEFVAGVCCSKTAGIPACGPPLSPSIANVEDHAVKFLFLWLSGQEFLKALWFKRGGGGGERVEEDGWKGEGGGWRGREEYER